MPYQRWYLRHRQSNRGRAPSSYVKPMLRKNRRYIKRRKSAHAQQRQLLSHNRAISKLNDAVGLTKQHAQYNQIIGTKIGYNCLNGPAGNYSSDSNLKGFNICELIAPGNNQIVEAQTRWAGWTPIFQSNNNVAQANKFWLEKMILRMNFEFENATFSHTLEDYTTMPAYPTDVTIFVVSFKNDAFPQMRERYFNNQNYLDPELWNADTSQQVWTCSPKYVGGQDAMPMLNPAVFNIHYYKQITLGNSLQRTTQVGSLPTQTFQPGTITADTTAFTTNIRDNRRNITARIPMGKLLKSTTGDSTWSQLKANELEHHERRWLIFHVSGNGGPGIPTDGPGQQAKIRVTCNFQYSGKVTN